MHLQSETAVPKGSIFGNGGPVVSKASAAQNYLIPCISAKEIAAARLANRFGVSLTLARTVCELSGFGGRA
ncbi:MAG: hypothetical protein ABS35_15500 [Kaistia sp. SCN 65-12]|nr:MAG: hypothetical protein ABS35_15500 [Kaistia sp. SCN 65-12]